MSMENLWNGTDNRKPKYSEESMTRCYFFHHKSYVDCSRVEPDSPRWVTVDQLEEFHVHLLSLCNKTFSRIHKMEYMPSTGELRHAERFLSKTVKCWAHVGYRGTDGKTQLKRLLRKSVETELYFPQVQGRVAGFVNAVRILRVTQKQYLCDQLCNSKLLEKDPAMRLDSSLIYYTKLIRPTIKSLFLKVLLYLTKFLSL